MVKIAVVWRKCANTQSASDQQVARLRENPNLVPDMGLTEYEKLFNSYRAAHASEVIPDSCLPHRRWLDRVNRDHLVGQQVPPYALGEIRLKTEAVVHHQGISRSADDLLKVADSIEWGVAVSTELDALSRIKAFWTGMEMLGHCALTWLQPNKITNDEPPAKVIGGPLDFLQKLEDERARTPGVEYLIIWDQKVRSEVYRLCTRSPKDHPSMSHALRELWLHHQYLWGEARTEARAAQSRQGRKRSAAEAGLPRDTFGGGGVIAAPPGAALTQPGILAIADTTDYFNYNTGGDGKGGKKGGKMGLKGDPKGFGKGGKAGKLKATYCQVLKAPTQNEHSKIYMMEHVRLTIKY